MDASILYRLDLAKTFMRLADENLRRGDPNSLAIAVVSTHDAVDNLLGAVASHLNVHLADDLTMLRTYDKIGSGGTALGARARLAQLNALRNDVKHQGLHPNPAVVRVLIPELRQFCDSTAMAIFGKPLSEIHAVDAIEDPYQRTELREIEGLVDSGDYRSALERMAFAMFEVYEKKDIGWKRFINDYLARSQGRVPVVAEWEWPEPHLSKTAVEGGRCSTAESP